MARVTIQKYMGDDSYSWAVFKDGYVVVAGVSRKMAQYYRDKVKKEIGVK